MLARRKSRDELVDAKGDVAYSFRCSGCTGFRFGAIEAGPLEEIEGEPDSIQAGPKVRAQRASFTTYVDNVRIPMISDTQSEIVGHRSDNYRTVVGA